MADAVIFNWQGEGGSWIEDKPFLLADREGANDRPGRLGMVHALTYVSPEERAGPRRKRIDPEMARGVGQALKHAGVWHSQRLRRVGDFKLGAAIYGGPGYQDCAAPHVVPASAAERALDAAIGN